jgi:hypothetical protein
MNVITQGEWTMATVAVNSWYCRRTLAIVGNDKLMTTSDSVLDCNLLPVTKDRRKKPYKTQRKKERKKKERN